MNQALGNIWIQLESLFEEYWIGRMKNYDNGRLQPIEEDIDVTLGIIYRQCPRAIGLFSPQVEIAQDLTRIFTEEGIPEQLEELIIRK